MGLSGVRALLTPRGMTTKASAILACLVIIGALESGCVAHRAEGAVFAATPGAPQALGAAVGLSPGMRTMLGSVEATSSDGDVAHPEVQPEFGIVFPLDEHSRGSAKVVFDPEALSALKAGLTEASAGLGHDFPISHGAGWTLAGELGASFVERVTHDSRSLLMARAATGPYLTLGPVRFYAAALVGTGVANNAAGVTSPCSAGCTAPSPHLTPLVSMGAGASVRLHKYIGINAEAWYPLTSVAVRLPPMMALSLNVGDLTPSWISQSPSKATAPPENAPEASSDDAQPAPGAPGPQDGA